MIRLFTPEFNTSLTLPFKVVFKEINLLRETELKINFYAGFTGREEPAHPTIDDRFLALLS